MGITFSDLSHNASDKYGYHILRVQQNSPAQQAGLQPFFDFILSIDGQSVNSGLDQRLLHRQLASHLGQPVQLAVYSSRLRRTRQVTLRPRDDWGGQGHLGASVRLCSTAGEPATAWRILDVHGGGPADVAGLRPGTDYIVGSAEASLHSPDDLFDLVEARPRCPVRLYVYCSLADRCREVTVMPDPAWGGEGALGCGIGYGYLHQIPAGKEAPYNAGSAQNLPSTSVPAAKSGSVAANATVIVV